MVRSAGLPEISCETDPLLCSTISGHSPAEGTHDLAVGHVVRMGFRNPDGTPAVNLKVLAGPPRTGPLWEGVTDATGVANIAISDPDADPYLVERQASFRFTNLMVSAFDNWPTASLEGAEPVERQGHGIHIGVVLNLGDPTLDAAHAATQDQVFTLQPESNVFTTTSSRNCSFQFSSLNFKCVEVQQTFPNVLEPVANNVGGGVDMTSRLTYTDTKATTQTFMVGSGADWVESEGEMSTETSSKVTDGSRVWGPNANRQYLIGINHVRELTEICGLSACYAKEVVRPFDYAGNFVPNPPASDPTSFPHRHDQARRQTATRGSDCVNHVDRFREATSNAAVSQEMAFSLSVDGKPFGVPLHARTRYTKADGTSEQVVHRWDVVDQPVMSFQHVYVPGGVVDPNDFRSFKCPLNAPDLAWTDAAMCDKTAGAAITACYTISQPEIDAKWRELGGSSGFLGDPTTSTADTACGGGRFNNFEGGTIHWRSDVGAHEVHGPIRDKWASLGSVCGSLGFPTSDETPTACGGGRREAFQGGTITDRADLGAHAVVGPIADKWTALGAECSYLGLPIYHDFDAYGPHPGGFSGEPYNGRLQYFERNDIFWNKLSNETIAYGEGGGLTGSYYSNFDYSTVALRRADTAINFDWGTGSPDPAVSADKFTIQWRGRLQIPADGNYTFSTLSDEWVMLKVCPDPRGFGCSDSGNFVINNSTWHTATEDSSSPVFLEAGTHHIVLFHKEYSGPAALKLSWSGPGISKQIIPFASASAALPEAPPLSPPADATAGDPTPLLQVAAPRGGEWQ